MELFEVLKNRRTIRSYASESLSEETIQKIVDAGCLAPIASAKYDKAHITIIENVEILNEMKSAVAEYFGKNLNPFYNAPVLILVSGKKYPPIGFGNAKWGQENIEIANTACIIQNMMLAATDLGLGSAYLTGFISCFTQNPNLLQRLQIPKGFTPLGGMLVGYKSGISKKLKASKVIAINYIK